MSSESRLTVSQRMLRVQTPVIPQIAELMQAHPGCISLGQGVVWYGPPVAAEKNIEGFSRRPANHRYAPVQGVPSLLDLIRQKLRVENGIRDDEGARRIVVTAGANMGFLNVVLAVTDPGDEVILPVPYYFNQEMALSMLNCVPVLVPTDECYQLRLDLIEAAIGPRTRAVVTISPNNPSGAVYSETSLREVNALCHHHGIYHISDEAYEYFVFEGAAHFSPGSIPGSEQHTISLYSLSKAYGFASWRVGYMSLPAHLYAAVTKAQDTNVICAPLISQHAAVGALQVGSSYCREQLAVTERVREIVLTELAELSEFCVVPRGQGAFYLLVKVDTALDAFTVAERLIREYGVAVIPGTAFGLDRACYLRVAYGALDEQTAGAGIRRLSVGLRALCRG